MKQTAAIILLCIFLLLQYNRQMSYYYCLLNITPQTTACVCTESVPDEGDDAPITTPPQKAGKIFFTEESFIPAVNYAAVGQIDFLYNSNFNYYRSSFYKYHYCRSTLKPPQRIA